MNQINSQLEIAKSALHTGRWTDAEIACNKILALDPDHLEASYLLASTYQCCGKFQQAIDTCKRIAHCHGTNADLLNNIGIACESLQLTENALDYYRQATRLDHTHLSAHYNLGRLQRIGGNLGEATTNLHIALASDPTSCPVLLELAMTLKAAGNYNEALVYLLRARDLAPGDPSTLNILGNTWQAQGKLEQAIDCYKSALVYKPGFAEALNNLGTTCLARGDVDAAIKHYRQAVQSNPDWIDAKSNLLLAENYQSNDPEALYTEHLQWAEPVESTIIRNSATKPGRAKDRIRIGYVSPDFRLHSVAYFLSALLKNHDKRTFESSCFANVAHPDGMTEKLQSYADAWHNICGMSDTGVYQLIQDCKIDILVDLAGHTAHNRLTLFAMQAAPVQVSYLGYPNTTGLSTMQYRITDEHADPQGQSDKLHSEELVRLPGGFLCYTPLSDCPDVTELPAILNKHITFGSFNVLAKISSECIQTWSTILNQIPGSRMLVKSAGLEDAATRDYLLERFAQCGVHPGQLELLARTPDFQSHMKAYQRVDIALDTFPYNGTTTSCEAFWMGVPVLTLAGNRHAGRVGCSLLSQIGLQQLIATDIDNYTGIARQLSDKPGELEKMRRTLRERVASSSLCNGSDFTRSFEASCQTMLEKTGL